MTKVYLMFLAGLTIELGIENEDKSTFGIGFDVATQEDYDNLKQFAKGNELLREEAEE